MKNPEDVPTLEQIETVLTAEISEIAEVLNNAPPAPDWALERLRKALELHHSSKPLSDSEATLYLLQVFHQELNAYDVMKVMEKNKVVLKANSPLGFLKLIKDMELAGLLHSRDVQDEGRTVPFYQISTRGREYLNRHAESEELAHVKALGLVPSSMVS